MTPRKLKLFVASFAYGGNGGVACEVPQIRKWWYKLLTDASRDERISDVQYGDFNDTPITMMRNRAVMQAKELGADVILLIDSDNVPDMYHPWMCRQPDPSAKPFFQTSFDFLYDQYDRGPVMVGAPYCGPPPDEYTYVFEFTTRESLDPNHAWKIDMIRREDSARRAGIQFVAAIATGLLMIDMRVFEHLKPPYFFYEYTDQYQQAKASTEDVVFTRNANLHVYNAIKRECVFCNWDAWAGHWKPKLVGKPMVQALEGLHGDLVDAVRNAHSIREKLTFLQGDGDEKAFDLTPALRGVPSLNGG